MNRKFERVTGISLVIGSIMMALTMVLHPAGGSIEKILMQYNMLITAHSLAIISMPFVAFGFYGLSTCLNEEYRISQFALIVMSFTLIASMLAATVNGLTLPFFLKKTVEGINDTRVMVNTVVQYGFSLNKAFDYLLIFGTMWSIGIWSFLMIRLKSFPAWLGWAGLGLGIIFLIILLSGASLIRLEGFRVYIFGIVLWMVLAGYHLFKYK